MRAFRAVLVDPSPLTAQAIGCAIRVHKALGPGLLESAYAKCLFVELLESGLSVEREVPVPVDYRGLRVDCAYRADLIVQGRLVLEVKSVTKLERVHAAQILTYLRLLNLREGFLLNFNVPRLKDGMKRFLR